MCLVAKWMLFCYWETGNNLWKNVLRSSIIFLKRKIFLKIFTERQQILLADLLPVLYYYFFVQSKCLFSGNTEMYFDLHLFYARSLFFAVTSEVLLSSVSWGMRCDKIWNCHHGFLENWILLFLQKLSDFKPQRRDCLCYRTWILHLETHSSISFLSVIKQGWLLQFSLTEAEYPPFKND